MEPNKLLAMAARSGRIGYVFLVGEKLRDWGLSRKASKSPELAAAYTQKQINNLKPDVLVTEKINTDSRKADLTHLLIDAIARTGEHNYLLDVAVSREQAVPNKIEEARTLAERYPELQPYVPKWRRLWDPEPRNLIYFEALVLALAVQNRPHGIGYGGEI